MNRLLPLLLGSAFLLGSQSQVDADEPAFGKRPNIVLVITDDQGYYDLSCHGNPHLATPHLDQLANESLRFTKFQVSPTCAPTRSAIMSGRAPFYVGVTHTILERGRPDDGPQYIPPDVLEAIWDGNSSGEESQSESSEKETDEKREPERAVRRNRFSQNTSPTRKRVRPFSRVNSLAHASGFQNSATSKLARRACFENARATLASIRIITN